MIFPPHEAETDFSPAIDFFKALHKNDAIVPKQTSYARVVSGGKSCEYTA